MLLKSLELQGFKSFPDKTKLTFNRGLTAVVGPNGSGKSNISDAVRWVLGEQSNKTLRGDKMEDVIFNGTQLRKAQGFAEATLTLDNTSRTLAVEHDEISITRKYYRSGDSEYLINGAPVRLKDINELFMDTGLGKDGYSIIGQGRIAEIVGAKSNERREIFEEAAGISKFRYRKNESEKRLKQAEENLVRLRDILSELEGRVEPLRIQSEKAQKFLTLAEQKKVLEITLWTKTLEKSKKNLSEQEDKISVCQHDYNQLEAEVERIENEIVEAQHTMQRCLADIDLLREQRDATESEISEQGSQIAVLNNDIGHLQENIRRLEEEIRALAMSDEDAGKEIEQKNTQIAGKEAKSAELDTLLAETENELIHLTAENDAYEAKLAGLNEALNKATLEQSELSFQKSHAEAQIAENERQLVLVQENIGVKRQELARSQNDFAENKQSLAEMDDRDQQLQNAIKGYELKQKSRSEKQEELRREVDRLDLQQKEKEQKAKLLRDLEQNLEGYAYSVKTVLKQAKAGVLKGIYGTVSQLIQVEDSYSVAVETALGGATQNLVCDNEGTAKAAIRMLKEQNGGRATFLPLTSVKGSLLEENGLRSCDGFVALGSELVQVDNRYDGIIRSLLGRIAVAEDLDAAVEIAKRYHYRFRIVTLDGQVINAGGSLTGGSQNKSTGLLSRKNEIEKLAVEAKTIAEKREQAQERLTVLTVEVNKLNAEIEAIRSEMQVLNEDRIRFEGEQKRLEHIIAQDEKQLADVDAEILRAQEKNKELTANITEYAARIVVLEADKSRLTAELTAQSGTREDMSKERDVLAAKISDLRIEKTECAKDIEILKQGISDIVGRRENAKEQQDRLLADIHDIRERIAVNETKIRSCEAETASARARIEAFNQQISAINKERESLEGKNTTLHSAEREISGKREGISRELARLEERKISIQKEYDDIIAKMWEEYELTRSEAEGIAIEVENIITAQRDLNDVKNKIRALGSVNVGAIEEYKEVSERYEFLKKQIDDVEASKSELLALISDLTAKMEDIFHESFAQINNNFGKIFTELFGGGKGELVLTDPENVLESGIEIKVQPPGKLIKNLASLSGGEQAFVAIAIYFAILKVRPAPFCILDEIEAALDDVNVVKYANYLRLMSDKTQFILITHRRGSMEEADVLYGVTMQEQGVSKLLALRVSEVEQQLGMKNIQ